MKKLWITVFATVVLTLPLSAQITKTISAAIPFDFVVQNQIVQAGTYIFSFQAGSGVVRMHQPGAKSSGFVDQPGEHLHEPAGTETGLPVLWEPALLVRD